MGSGMCNKCRHVLGSGATPRIKPQRDVKRSRVCNVCAHTKRTARAIYDKRVQNKYDDTHGNMWKSLSTDVRSRIEKKFRSLYELRLSQKCSRVKVAAYFRKIEYEISWISCDDGDLHKHYQNRLKRIKREELKCKK